MIRYLDGLIIGYVHEDGILIVVEKQKVADLCQHDGG